MSFARVVPDEDGFKPTAYQNPPAPFVRPADRELMAILEEGIAASEEARVARDLGIEVTPHE